MTAERPSWIGDFRRYASHQDPAKNRTASSDLESWDTFPFQGNLTPRPLQRPMDDEFIRDGAGGQGCATCESADDAIWANERWRVTTLSEPSGLPAILFLQPVEHVAEQSDLSDEMAAEFGVLSARIERAILAIGDIGRVHICKWGEGAEHLHWWFLARPARMYQLMSSFAEMWDEVLPPTPQNIWDANLAIIRRELQAKG